MISFLDHYDFHDVSLVKLLNKGFILSDILSFLGFSILDILYFCLAGCICLGYSV